MNYQRHKSEESVEDYLEKGDMALGLLRDSAYSKLRQDVTENGWICHGEYNQHNVLMIRKETAVTSFEHWGFDVASIEKALAHNERNENRIRGASTISQQTAKNLFLWDGRSWVRKGLEAGLTLGIETVWSKKRILTVYLNIAEFGDGVFGVEAAAQRYFHKPASKLTRSEAALLAAVLPNPLRFKVSAPSGYVRSRQAWILRQMYQLGGEPFMQQHQLD